MKSGAVLGDEDVLGAPALVGRVGLERGVEAHHLEEIEAHAVGARHREDRAAVALERARARLAAGAPTPRPAPVERHRRAARGGAARLERALVQRPGEDELLRLGRLRAQTDNDEQGFQEIHASPHTSLAVSTTSFSLASCSRELEPRARLVAGEAALRADREALQRHEAASRRRFSASAHRALRARESWSRPGRAPRASLWG